MDGLTIWSVSHRLFEIAMLKRCLLFVSVLFGLSFLVMACDDDDDYKAPSAVKSAFEKKYPGAKKVEWEKKGEYEKVEFQYLGNSAEAWFLRSGSWVFTETDLRATDMPSSVIAAFQSGMYGTWAVDEYSRIDQDRLPVLYCIEAESVNEDVLLYYNESGRLIRTVPDIDKPDDLPASVWAQIERQHPSAVLLEVHRTSDMRYEVDLLDRGVIKTMFFVDNQWTETRTLVAVDSLPNAVREALKVAAYDGYVVDHAYSVVYPNEAGVYIVGLTKPGSVDLLVRIRENGELLQE